MTKPQPAKADDAKPDGAQEVFLPKLILWIRDNIWRILEVIGIVAALVAVGFSIEQSILTRRSINQATVVNAWQILTAKAPGTSGKREAMEALYAAGQSLSGIDISCEAMDGGWNEETNWCERRTNLMGINLSKQVGKSHANLSGAKLDGAIFFEAKLAGIFLMDVNLKGAELSGADLKNAELYGANLEDSDLTQVDLRDAQLIVADLKDANLGLANLEDAYMSGADLEDAYLSDADLRGIYLAEANLRGAELRGANLSGARFCDEGFDCAENLTMEQLNEAWAWADNLPIFEAGGSKLDLNLKRLCDPALREVYEAKQKFGIPEGCEAKQD